MQAYLMDTIRRRANDIKDIVMSNGRWGQFIDHLCKEHFIDGESLDQETKQRLFEQSIHMVEFEPHSFCNRLCTFCSNVFLDRRSNRSELKMEIYEKVLNDLSRISYKKGIRFALYSEPLASPTITDYIALSRNKLPSTDIDLITNGDYLRKEMLVKLRSAGLDSIRNSVYPKGYIWNKAEAKKRLKRWTPVVGQCS